MRSALTAVATALIVALSSAAVHAQAITDDTVDAAVASAKTVADHQALAAYFTAKSEQAKATVAQHQKMASALTGKQGGSWQAHCQSLIKTYQEQAKDYAGLAKVQTALATGMQHAQ